ncbi:MAG: DNA helicase RecQ [Deltaproteobacteria bacterium]|nr:DNA helicase RecQ [Deltaproteobacteria bacterium]
MNAILKKYWGYDSFRPFQEKIIQAILASKDSLTILPTGGGKSLCFQIPALLKEGMAVVVSPLIALMKDQVDGLKEMGIAADYLNSSQTGEEQQAIFEKIQNKKIKLLYLAPERLKIESTLQLLKSVTLSFFVIDEAHCISEWGHDFRADYRQLRFIKETFENIPVHAFTATATPHVEKDIVQSLNLVEPQITIAPIDRPNLTFRVAPRSQAMQQIIGVLEMHKGNPGIIYCLRRADVDEISEKLNAKGYKNVAYHAGLSDEVRRAHHEKFSREEVDIVVATIAFGMGIDRSNIRFVIHSAMPKNVEQYQQETGRAGRDGLASFCYLFHNGGDFHTWTRILSDSAHEKIMMEKLGEMYRFCTEPRCRHQSLVRYFGQTYEKTSCEACDYCLGEMEMVADPLILAQKILSCVIRVKERFGADHVARVLKGDATDNITRWGHQNLSTFGLLKDNHASYIRSLIEQLAGQNFLKRNAEFKTLSVTELGWEILKGEKSLALVKPVVTAKKKKEIAKERKKIMEGEWSDIDQKLFQALREKRSELAVGKGVPAYFIFGDKSLREMARLKPVSLKDFALIPGVGDHKLKAYGEIFIGVIVNLS